MRSSVYDTAVSKVFLVVFQMLALASCVGQDVINISSGATFQTAYLDVDSRFIRVGETATLTLGSSSQSFESIEAADVRFSTTGGSSVGEFSAVTKNSDDTFEVGFTGVTPGSKTYFAVEIKGRDIESIGQSVFRVTPNNYSLTTSTISVDDAAPTAGDIVTITIQTKDDDGSDLTVGGLNVSCTGATITKTRSVSAITDHGDGSYTATYMAKEASNATTISCKLNNESMTNTASFTANPAAASRLAVKTGNHQSATINTALSPFVVIVKDAYDNTIANETVDWSIDSWVGEGSAGTLSAASSDSNINGEAQITHTFANKIGVLQVVAEVASASSAIVVFEATATAGVPSSMTINSGNNQIHPINSPFPEALEVLVKDAEANAVGGVPVTWVLTGTGTLVTSPISMISTSGADGVAALDISSYSAVEKFEITATAAGGTNPSVTFDNLEGRLGDPATITIESGNNQSKRTDGDLDESFVIIVKDMFDNPLPNTALEWEVLSGGGSFPAGAPALTGTDGRASADFKNGFAPGLFQVQVKSQTHPEVSAVFEFEAEEGTPNNLAKSAGDQQRVVLGSVSEEQIIVQLRDENNVPLIGKRISWEVLTSGHIIVASNPDTNDAGESWVKVKVSETLVGPVEIQASYGGLTPVVFTIDSIYHELASDYFNRLIDDHSATFTDDQKVTLSKFAQGLDDLGLMDRTNEIWLMRKKFNVGTGSTVYGFLDNSDMTLVDNPTWSAEDQVNPTNYGICFNGTTQYATADANTQEAEYNNRGILVLVQRLVDIGATTPESYAQTSNQSFDDDINGAGKGFKIGQTVGWGNWDAGTETGDFANMSVAVPLNFVTAIQSQINSGSIETFVNAYKKPDRSISVDEMGDSNPISFASRNGSSGGLNGCMPMAMHFATSLSDQQTRDLHDLIKETVGFGLPFP